MALVAKMAASEVNAKGGGRWAPCAEEDDGAQAVEGLTAIASMYGVPPWLTTTGWVRYEPVGQNAEHIKLTAVSAKGEDDPNREWAMASPSGSLEIYIQNPAAFGYVQAGQEYRVTIEKIRGPKFVGKPSFPGITMSTKSENSMSPSTAMRGLILAETSILAQEMAERLVLVERPALVRLHSAREIRWEDGRVAYVRSATDPNALRGLSVSWAWCGGGLGSYPKDIQGHVRMALREPPRVLVAGPDEIPTP